MLSRVVVVAALLSGPVVSQVPKMLRDLNGFVPPESSVPKDLQTIGGHTYFTASTTLYGRQLYRSRGVKGSAQRLTSFPKVGGGVRRFAALGNQIFCVAEAGLGPELYVFDAKQATPTVRLVKDLSKSRLGPDPTGMTPYKGFLYFRGYDPATGYELYRTDGTAANTALLKDLVPGTASSVPGPFIEFGGFLWFSATTPKHGWELWRTDGTAQGTILFADIFPGVPGSAPQNFTVFKNELYFSAGYVNSGHLWKTDGKTAKGVFTFPNSPSNPTTFSVFKNHLYMVTGEGMWDLWRTDGTTTKRVGDLNGANYRIEAATSTFLAGTVTIVGKGREMFVHDGNKTTLIDLNKGSGGSWIRPMFGRGNGQLLFATGAEHTVGLELWTSDGSVAGTKLLVDIHKGIKSSAPEYFVTGPSGKVLFAAQDGASGRELWQTDGTAAGTSLLHNIAADPPIPGSAPHGFVDSHGEAYFAATSLATGTELYVSDGTSAGTLLVRDLQPGPGSSNPSSLTVVGHHLFFVAELNGQPVLYGLDMKRGGIRTLATGLIEKELIAYRGRCYFGAAHGKNGVELCSTDGTIAGTRLEKDIVSGAGNSIPKLFARAAGRLYFMAFDPNRKDWFLWRSDGTAAGTHAVTSAAAWSRPQYMVGLRDRLVWTDGTRLFETIDATGATTQVSLAGVTEVGWFEGLYAVGDRVYFSALQQKSGRELFVYHKGSANLLFDVYPGRYGSKPASFARVGTGLVFAANDGGGREPWVTDGTRTLKLKDINPSGGSDPREIISVGDQRVFFSAAGPGGAELWESNGTGPGTRRVADIYPGPTGSQPRELSIVGDKLFFAARDQGFGVEPFALNVNGVANQYGLGCRRGAAAPVLAATDPRIDQRLTLTVRGAALRKSGMLALGQRASGSRVASLDGCTIYMDFAVPSLALGFTTGAGGAWSLPVKVPNTPGLVGLLVSAQPALGPTTTAPLGVDLTNLITLDIGR